MTLFPRRFALIGLLLLAYGQPALADKYVDPSGFSFDYEEGWAPVTRTVLQDINSIIPPEMKDWAAKSNINFNAVAVALIREGQDAFLENINVIVQDQQIPVDNATAQKVAETIRQAYSGPMMKIEHMQERIETVAFRTAIVLEFDSQLPGVSHPLHQKQILIPVGGKTYILTCTAMPSTFDRYEPEFNKVLASFQAPAPITRGFNWSGLMSTSVVGGLIGGIVGGILGALGFYAKLFPKNKAASNTSDTSPQEADLQ